MTSTRTEVPSRWAKSRFTELAVRRSGVKIPKASKSIYQTNGKFPVVDQGQDMVTGFVDDDELQFPGQLPVIVFGDHTRIFKYVDFPFVPGADGTQIITPRPDRVDASFLYYALCNLPLTNLGYSRHFKLLKEQTVCFPESLCEQRKIAAILSSVDDAIEKTQAVIDQVQVVKRGLMQELLTRGLPGRHTQFKKTEIGEIPEEWDLRPAATVCERIVVGIVIKPAQYYTASGVPCLRSLNVTADQINYRSMKYISHESNHQLRKSQLSVGDVVTVRTGYPGTSAVIPAQLDGANCVDLIITTPGPSLRGTFLSRFINSDRGRAAVAERRVGLAQQHFNVGAMKAMLTPIPSLEEQDDICNVVQSSDQNLQAETALRHGLFSLKAALMSVLLSGELRVTPDTETA